MDNNVLTSMEINSMPATTTKAKATKLAATVATTAALNDTAPDQVITLGTLYGQVKTVAWRTFDIADRSTAIVHRSVVLADESNQLWADTTSARRRKEAADALAEIDNA